ncbi:MAG: hypothetical protein IT559_08895 [Alphaproteobacteria bacterium]|nr:hypothetical protein [Alphaproteobacteria bacterium]
MLSLLSGFGLMVTMPGWLTGLHEMMHDQEVTMILISASVILLGWGLYFYTRRSGCVDHECGDRACQTHQRFSIRMLVIASVLVVFNIFVYFVFHAHQQDMETYLHGHAAAVQDSSAAHDHGLQSHGHEP